MTRTNAREIAAHLLYAMEYTGQSAAGTLEARLEPDYYRGLAQESEAYAERPGKKQLAADRVASLQGGVAGGEIVPPQRGVAGRGIIAVLDVQDDGRGDLVVFLDQRGPVGLLGEPAVTEAAEGG